MGDRTRNHSWRRRRVARSRFEPLGRSTARRRWAEASRKHCRIWLREPRTRPAPPRTTRLQPVVEPEVLRIARDFDGVVGITEEPPPTSRIVAVSCPRGSTVELPWWCFDTLTPAQRAERDVFTSGRGFGQRIWPEPATTPLEAALLSGFLWYFDKVADKWRMTSDPDPRELPDADEAQEAILYLRRHRWWPARGELPANPPSCWGNHSDWSLAINGPTEGREARWFSWAQGFTNRIFAGITTSPAAMATMAANSSTFGLRGPATVSGDWDWTLPANPQGFTDRPAMIAPWPLWADELTARRRLLQEMLRLLYEANADRWQGPKGDARRRRVILPGSRHWEAVSRRVSAMGAGIEPRFTKDFAVGLDSHKPYAGVPYRLWLLVNGVGHVRRCRACERWVLTYHRPRLTCDSTCRANVRRGRKTSPK